MRIEDIVDALRHNRIRITDHADEEAQADPLAFDEIFFSVFQGEIIEYYPDDIPYPSCLIYGDTFAGAAVHSVWAYNQDNQWTAVLTVHAEVCLSCGDRLYAQETVRRFEQIRAKLEKQDVADLVPLGQTFQVLDEV